MRNRWICSALALVTAAGLVVAGGPAVAAPEAAGHHLDWRVDRAPFRLDYGAVAQAPGTTAGPGGRMSYPLADGTTHRLTDLSQPAGAPRDRPTPSPPTSRPAPRQVTVRSTPRGLRVDWTFQPAAGVTQVYEALTGNDAEHFLGGGANFIYTDLRHRTVLLNKAHFTGACALNRVQQERRAEPVLPQLTRLRRLPRHDAHRPAGVPERRRRPAALLDRPAAVPGAARPARPHPALLQDQHPRVRGLRGLPHRGGAGVQRRRPACRRCRRRASSRSPTGGTRPAGQATVLDDVDQMQSRGIPMAPCGSTTRGRPRPSCPGGPQQRRSACNGTLTVRPRTSSPTRRRWSTSCTRRAYTWGLGLAARAGRRPPSGRARRPATRRARSSRPAAPTVAGHRPDQPGRRAPTSRPSWRSCSRLGVDMVKGDRGEEFELRGRRRSPAAPGTDSA